MAADVLSSFLQGYQGAQELGQQNRLMDMRQQAFDAEQSAAAQKQAGEDRDRQLATLQQTASLYGSAPDMLKPHLYGQIVDLAEGVGFAPKGQLPRQLTPETEPKFQQFLQSFAGMGQKDDTPSAIRELQLLQANPELAALDMKRRTAGFDRPQLIQTDSGYAWATPQGATPLNYGGQGEAAPAIDQSAVQRNLAMLGASPGVQMTSGLRTPERNAAVGGKPNSQHLRGTAGDYVVPQAQKADFMRQVESAGLQAIDEGDHVHVQQPRGGSRVMPAQKEQAPSALQERIAAAQAMGASEDDIRRMVIGREGAAAGAKPLPTQALGQLLDVQDALAGAQSVASIIQKHAGRMTSGDLVVGPADALGARFRTAVGMSNANDVNMNEFRADLTRIVNESLRLNSGVQTEGDAQRAAQELMAANDQATAARALKRMAEINRRAVTLQKQKQSLIRKNYGQDANGNPIGQQQAAPANDDDALIGKYL